MDRAGDVFGTPERLHVWKVGVHLGRRFGARRVLENHLDAVDRQLFNILRDNHVWRNKPGVSGGHVLAD